MDIENRSKVLMTIDEKGNKLAVLPQIIFGGKRSISWNEVERYLMRYVGEIVEITETKDVVYIGRDFVDEFAGSVYTRKLRGGVAKAKANMVQGIPELIEIAGQKRWKQDYENKHKKKAEKGWYRYNTRFALPVMNENGGNCKI